MPIAGILKKLQWLLMKLLLLCLLVSITEANVPNNLLIPSSGSTIGAPKVAPAMPDLPLPANTPQSNRPWRKPFLRLGSPVQLSPTLPPSTSHFSKPLMRRSGLAPSFFTKNISPTQSHLGALPSGLAQPPLSPSVSSKLGSGLILLRFLYFSSVIISIIYDYIITKKRNYGLGYPFAVPPLSFTISISPPYKISDYVIIIDLLYLINSSTCSLSLNFLMLIYLWMSIIRSYRLLQTRYGDETGES